MQQPVYLDYNATTPCDPRVVEAMLPYFTQRFGNASSKSHSYGLIAEDAVEAARESVAELIGAAPADIIFTSGATESLNLAIRGSLPQNGHVRLITFATEHSAVLDTVRHLSGQGHVVDILPANHRGGPDISSLEAALTSPADMLILMLANNETGTINPVDSISTLCKRKGIRLICDATQAVGKIPVDVRKLGADLVAFSGHKLYGPKGVGALWINGQAPAVKLNAIQFGGGHERRLRSGTLNVTGIVGLGEAARIASAEMESDGLRLKALKDSFTDELIKLPAVTANSDPDSCLPQTVSITFGWPDGHQLLRKLAPKIAASSGSACSSATTAPSHVLTAIGLSEKEAFATIRFSLGKFTTAADMETAIDAIRRLAPA